MVHRAVLLWRARSPSAEGSLGVLHDVALVHQGDALQASLDGVVDRRANQSLAALFRHRLDADPAGCRETGLIVAPSLLLEELTYAYWPLGSAPYIRSRRRCPRCFPGALVHRGALAGTPSGARGHDHFPGEHRGHLRRDRIQGAEASRPIASYSFSRRSSGASTIRFPETSGIGIKPISEEGSKRLIRAALDYAVRENRKSVTLVHKGNIMKYTEGAFRDWGYEVARQEYGAVDDGRFPGAGCHRAS